MNKLSNNVVNNIINDIAFCTDKKTLCGIYVDCSSGRYAGADKKDQEYVLSILDNSYTFRFGDLFEDNNKYADLLIEAVDGNSNFVSLHPGKSFKDLDRKQILKESLSYALYIETGKEEVLEGSVMNKIFPTQIVLDRNLFDGLPDGDLLSNGYDLDSIIVNYIPLKNITMAMRITYTKEFSDKDLIVRVVIKDDRLLKEGKIHTRLLYKPISKDINDGDKPIDDDIITDAAKLAAAVELYIKATFPDPKNYNIGDIGSIVRNKESDNSKFIMINLN